MSKDQKFGMFGWVDLTCSNADEVRDFYKSVVGWSHQDIDMGGYADYAMTAGSDDVPVAGICHKQGTNADLPTAWLVYITVPDLNASVENCRKLGGKVLAEPKVTEGYGSYAIIEDPAGAVCALFEPVE